MSDSKKRKTIVIGHKNPDTDSICSAICYANLKRILTGEKFTPARAGHVNSETQYVLDYFGVEAPKLIENVRTQVKDIEIRETAGVQKNEMRTILPGPVQKLWCKEDRRLGERSRKSPV